MNGCRELGCCSAVCLCCVLVGLRFDGFVMVRSGLASIDRSPDHLREASCFPFYRPKESMGYSGGREENEREKKSSRIVGSFFSFMWVLLTL